MKNYFFMAAWLLLAIASCSDGTGTNSPDGGEEGTAIDASDGGGVEIGATDGADSGGEELSKTYVDDIEHIGLDINPGWQVVYVAGAPAGTESLSVTKDPSNVKEGTGTLEFGYTRSQDAFPGIFAPVLVAELESFSIWVKAEKDAELLFAVADRDGARFASQVTIPAGSWNRVELRPDSFALLPDSPVQKTSLETERLSAGMVIVDIARGQSADTNTLWLDDVEIVRKPLLLLEDLALQAGSLVIDESALVKGDAVLAGQSSLEVRAPRLHLRGGVTVTDGSSFSVEGAVVDSEQQYVTQYGLDTATGGSITLRDALLYTRFPQFLRSRAGCSLVLERFQSLIAATHIETEPSSRVTISESSQIGELVLYPGAQVNVSASDYILVWLFTPSGTTGTYSLPDGSSVNQFSLPNPFDLSVTNTTNVLWGLVSYPGSNVTFTDSHLLVAGLLFLGSTQQSLSGFHNGGAVPDLSGLSDRTLAFQNSNVDTWNFYPAENSDLQLSDCTFGELLAFGQARAEVSNSSCDGSGGYLGTQGSSSVAVYSSRLDTDITTFDDSNLLLDGCTVHGTIRATGNSTVTLRNTTVDGELLEFDGAKIIVE